MADSEATRTVHLTITDPRVMRAMAHPARVAIIEHLGDGREATATECAEVCGLSPSATSYHLRALAKLGLVEEAPSRGDGRERVWRAAVTSYRIDIDRGRPVDVHSAASALIDVLQTRDDRKAREWFARAHEEPQEWYDAAGMIRRHLVMTAGELAGLLQAVDSLMAPYHRAERRDPPPGARTVMALFRALPD